MLKHWRIAPVSLLTLAATSLLFVFMKSPLFGISIFEKDILNFYMNYELSTLILSASLLLVIYFSANKLRLSYLSLNKIDGAVRPVPLIGLHPKDGEGWRTIGLTIGAIITIVTGIVVYFQVAAGGGLTFQLFPEVPLVFLFALMNSFTEEVIFRLSFTTIFANEKFAARVSEIISAVVFGAVHYFGIAPNGIAGALMAGFIGWFLAKSINETKGFFWAWAIHFAQDVVIMFFLFMK